MLGHVDLHTELFEAAVRQLRLPAVAAGGAGDLPVRPPQWTATRRMVSGLVWSGQSLPGLGFSSIGRERPPSQ